MTSAASQEGRAGPLSIVLLFSTLVLFVVLAWSQGICTQDDAYISFRYARNLADGNGLVFNPGERVEGYTNFLWTVVFAGVIGLGVDPVPASRVLGIAFGGALVVLTWVFAGRTFKESPWLRSIAPLLLAVSPPLLAESAMGLETVMFAFLVLLGCHRCLIELERDARFPTFALVFALAALTRPEGVLTFALMCGCCLIVRRSALRTCIPFLVRSAVVFTVPVAAHVAWRLSYYGLPFPNTYYAKTGGGWEQIRFGARYLRHFLANFWWLPVPFYALAWSRARSARTLFPLVLVLVYSAYVVKVGGDFKDTYRFFVPTLAPLWLMVATGISVILDRLAPGTRAAGPVGAAALVLAALGGLGMLASFDDTSAYVERRRERVADVSVPAAAEWLDANTPEGEYIALSLAGRLPFGSQARFIDLWGLTDPVIARSPDPTGKMSGHLRSNPRYVLERAPLYVLLTPWHGAEPVRKRDYWAHFRVERQLLELRGFRNQYELLNEPLAGGYLHVFRRKQR